MIDVALVRNQLTYAVPGTIARTKRIDAPIDLGHDLWLGRLDHELIDQVRDACMPAGLHFPLHHAWGFMYSMFRTNAPQNPNSQYQWDPDGRLNLAIRLSRLVHPTSISCEFTARVADPPEVATRVIAPSHIKGWGAKAQVLDTDADRLTAEDAAVLRQLLAVYNHATTSERLKSALFYFEMVALTKWVDLRWVTLTTACESLIHVDGERDPGNPARYSGSTNVFVRRMSRLTTLVDGAPLPDDDLRQMYRQRSALAHGLVFTGMTPEKRRLYGSHENALRRILLKAVLDPAFAAFFLTDESIQAALPLE